MSGSMALEIRPQQKMLVYIDNNFKFSNTECVEDLLVSKVEIDCTNEISVMESLIKDIALVTQIIYERALLSKECIDLMQADMAILAKSDNKDTILKNINIKRISREYSGKINNIYSKYGINKKSIFDNIATNIKIYHDMYGDIPEDIKDKLLEEIDDISAHIGIILFNYGRQGKTFNTLYEYYYNLGGEHYRELHSQFTLIISWMKYMHKSCNYYAEDLKTLCDYIKTT